MRQWLSALFARYSQGTTAFSRRQQERGLFRVWETVSHNGTTHIAFHISHHWEFSFGKLLHGGQMDMSARQLHHSCVELNNAVV